MADVKWIKITTDIFDDEKILLIESLPDAYAIIVVWFKLLCLAGKQNNSGVFMMNDKIAYTDKMLSTIFRMKESTVTMALETFEQFGMIEMVDGVITIPNWGKHQSLEQIEARREYQKMYQREYRKKQKEIALLEDKHSRKCLREQNVNSLEEDIDIEEDKNKNPIVISNDITRQTQDVRRCVEEWNSLAEYGIKSISRIDCNSKRYKSLVARINQYGVDDVLKAIDNIRHSDFLQGKHKGKPWQITFDWFVLPNNFPKVLEGNYNNGGNDNGCNGRTDGTDEAEDEFTRLCREYGI